MTRWSCFVCACIAVTGLSVGNAFSASVPSQKTPTDSMVRALPALSPSVVPVTGKTGLTVDQLIGNQKPVISNKPQTSQSSALSMTSLAAAAPASQPALDPRPLNVAQHVTVDPRSGAAVVSIPLTTPSGETAVSSQAQWGNL
jgi:hypothetical protein